jgi:hypothetical protein
MNSVTEPLVRLAARVDAIQPFYVMELAKEAALLERDGRDIIHMGIGEPDFTAPEPVIEAAASITPRSTASASIRRGSSSPPARLPRCCWLARRWSIATMKC